VSFAARLANAELSLASEDGTSRGLTIGKNASYSAFGLKPGRCMLHLWGRGLAPLDEELVLPPDQEKVRHDITVRRALTLPVKFVTKSTGASFAIPSRTECNPSVVVTRDRPTRIANVLGRSAPASRLGSYREHDPLAGGEPLPSGSIGVLDVYAEPPVIASCVLHDSVITTQVVRGNETELVFELDPAELESALGALTLHCVDARSGVPVESARVAVNFQDAGGGGTAIGADGVAHFERLAPGMRSVEITAPNFARYARWIRIPRGETLNMGTVELRAATELRGRVLDADGHGVSANITAIAERAFSSPRAADSRMSTRSSSSGSFSVTWVEADRLSLVVTHESFAIAALDVDATSGNVAALEIRVTKGTPVTFVLSRASTGPADFVIADASGRPLALRSAFATYSPRVRLTPGAYELRYVVDDEVVRKEALDVGDEPIVHEVRAP
jgi:hypothetical protein